MISKRITLSVTAVGIAASLCISLSSRADELLSKASDRFRQKEYRDSLSLAKTAADSPQRFFLMGVSAQRLGRDDEALPLLKEAEQKLPLLADYAALYQIEALVRLKRYPETSAKIALFPKAYPGSLLTRRVEKLGVDVALANGNGPVALKVCQDFIEKYPSGGDSIEVLFSAARSREEAGDREGAVQVYRSIWLNNPTAPQAKLARERLKEIEKAGGKVSPFTADELLRRASALFAKNEFGQTLQTLKSIPQQGLPVAVTSRIDLRAGMAQFRQRAYKEAEKSLSRAAASGISGISSEARFWLARAVERQEQTERAFGLYMELADEGKKQEFSDDALMEAAGLRRGQRRYAEAARLFEQVIRTQPDSRFVPRASWDAGWCHYLAGEYPSAAEAFRGLLKDEAQREKALYWLARALEKGESPEAAGYYRQLLDDFPAGFYATWHREQRGIADTREPLGPRQTVIEASLPAGFEKPRLLAALGLNEEARNEMSAARKKAGDKKSLFPGLARLYLDMGDYGSAIALFLQNRPVKWDKASLPLWTAGYPRAFPDEIARCSSANGLSEALVFSLIRAESGFTPAIKSPAGAIGLMQMMPATAKLTAREKGSFDAARLIVPDYNIKLGTRHVNELLKVYDGDVVYSVAAYNAGAAAVDRWRKGLQGLAKDEFIESIPYQETRDYVKKVYAAAATYRRLYGMR